MLYTQYVVITYIGKQSEKREEYIYIHMSWTIKKAERRRTDASELWCRRRLLRVPWRLLPCKKIKPVNPKGNQSWRFIGRTDAETETPILLPPDVKSWLTGKDPDGGKDWEEKGATEDKMVGRHHRLNGREFEQALGSGDRQGSLPVDRKTTACCSPCCH